MTFWCTSAPAIHLSALNKIIIFFTWHEEVKSGSGYKIHILECTVHGGWLILWPWNLSRQGKKKEKCKATLPPNFSSSEPPSRPAAKHAPGSRTQISQMLFLRCQHSAKLQQFNLSMGWETWLWSRCYTEASPGSWVSVLRCSQGCGQPGGNIKLQNVHVRAKSWGKIWGLLHLPALDSLFRHPCHSATHTSALGKGSASPSSIRVLQACDRCQNTWSLIWACSAAGAWVGIKLLVCLLFKSRWAGGNTEVSSATAGT